MNISGEARALVMLECFGFA